MEDMDAAYRQHAQTVYRYLWSLCRSDALAEELTQETFYQAVRSASRFDGSCKISTWLCQIAKHVWYKELARKKRQDAAPLPDTLPDPALAAEDALLHTEEKVALYRAIHALGEPMREVVLLRLSGEFSFAEIGAVLGRSENWARVTFYRAKQKLAKEDE